MCDRHKVTDDSTADGRQTASSNSSHGSRCDKEVHRWSDRAADIAQREEPKSDEHGLLATDNVTQPTVDWRKAAYG